MIWVLPVEIFKESGGVMEEALVQGLEEMGVQTPDRVDRQGTHVFHIADMGTFLKKSVHLDGDLVEPASARGECKVSLSLFAEKRAWSRVRPPGILIAG